MSTLALSTTCEARTIVTTDDAAALVHAAADAVADGRLEDLSFFRCGHDGFGVALAPAGRGEVFARTWAAEHGVEVRAMCSLCTSSASGRCPMHREVAR